MTYIFILCTYILGLFLVLTLLLVCLYNRCKASKYLRLQYAMTAVSLKKTHITYREVWESHADRNLIPTTVCTCSLSVRRRTYAWLELSVYLPGPAVVALQRMFVSQP